MFDDPLQNLSRIFTETVRVHGVEIALKQLPEETYNLLRDHFLKEHWNQLMGKDVS